MASRQAGGLAAESDRQESRVRSRGAFLAVPAKSVLVQGMSDTPGWARCRGLFFKLRPSVSKLLAVLFALDTGKLLLRSLAGRQIALAWR